MAMRRKHFPQRGTDLAATPAVAVSVTMGVAWAVVMSVVGGVRVSLVGHAPRPFGPDRIRLGVDDGAGMQGREFGGVAVMAGHARSGVFGVEDCVGDQLSDVVVVQAVEDGGAFAAGADQSRHPQLRQVLRHRRGRLPDMCCQVIDRHLPAHQCPQHLDAGGIGEHPEHFDDQVHLVIGEPTTTSSRICIHTQIVGLTDSHGQHECWCTVHQRERALAARRR